MKENYSTLISDIAFFIEQGQKAAVRYVNTAAVTTYWFVGRRIVDYEQKGEKRAEYGRALLEHLSNDLTKQVGRGWSEQHLRAVRQFYLTYSDIEKRYTMCSESHKPEESKIQHTLCSELIHRDENCCGTERKEEVEKPKTEIINKLIQTEKMFKHSVLLKNISSISILTEISK